jgi:hypothetical protein
MMARKMIGWREGTTVDPIVAAALEEVPPTSAHHSSAIRCGPAVVRYKICLKDHPRSPVVLRVMARNA